MTVPAAGDTRVRLLQPADSRLVAAWDEFVLGHPEATFFHRAGWQPILRQIYGHDTYYLIAECNGQVVGVLPLGHVKSLLFGNTLSSLPFGVYGGVLSTTPEAAALLEQEAEHIATRLKVSHLEYRNVNQRHGDWPTQDLYVTFRKEIFPDDEANMLSIPRKQRAMVRKGIKNELRGELDENADRFFALFADNVHRHGTPAMPKRYFNALKHEFGRDCEILTIVAPDGEPVSSVLSFYFRDEVLPYYAGDAERARDLAANDFKYWELMRRASARGIRVFDYGRSKVGTGTYAFKKNWGFEATPLHYEYRLFGRESVPQNNPNNPKYWFLIQTWKRMPLWLANFIGPFIVRNLG